MSFKIVTLQEDAFPRLIRRRPGMPQSGAQIVFVLPPTFEKTLSI